MATINQSLVRMYVNLIDNDRRTIEDVPAAYKAAVQAELDGGKKA